MDSPHLFDVEARDETEPIGQGGHELFVIDKKRFDEMKSRKKGI